jgi:hypothetical protein
MMGNVRNAMDAFDEVVALLPQSKKMQALGAMNELYLFLEQCLREQAATDSSSSKNPTKAGE